MLHDAEGTCWDQWLHIPVGPFYIYTGPSFRTTIDAATSENRNDPLNKTELLLENGNELYFADDLWIFTGGYWYKPSVRDYNHIYNNSIHPKRKPETAMHKFEQKINTALESIDQDHNTLQEGMIINVNTMVSDAIRVPEGNYIIAVSNSDHCILIPTSETSGERFEVFKPTLAGFFNPEIHKKTVGSINNDTIAESDS